MRGDAWCFLVLRSEMAGHGYWRLLEVEIRYVENGRRDLSRMADWNGESRVPYSMQVEDGSMSDFETQLLHFQHLLGQQVYLQFPHSFSKHPPKTEDLPDYRTSFLASLIHSSPNPPPKQRLT